MLKERTLKEKISFEGIGIHTGEKCKVILHPEEEGKGINFYKKGIKIPLSWKYVVNTIHSTDIGKGGEVIKTVEHLLASLHLLYITNLTIEVIGIEIPTLDGSAYIFYRELKEILKEQEKEIEFFEVQGEILVKEGDKFIKAEPSDSLEITYEGEFKNFLGNISYTYNGNPEEIVRARTFCYEWEVENIRKMGLGKGGSLSNTLVLCKDGVLNPEGLIYPDEPVRHKALDLIGDIYLLGKPVKGKFYSYKGGHSLNFKLLKEICMRSSLEVCVVKE